MKKKISTILIVFVFLIGLSVMLYPTISDWYNQRVNSYVVSGYVEEVEGKSDEYYEEMFAIARAYNSTLSGTVSSFVSGEADGEDYINALNVVDGMMGYLVIDKIDVSLGIYHGTDEGVLQRYIGHLQGTQLPTGDIGNNTVLTGHTGLPTADLLTGLTEMEIGDTFEVVVLNEVFTYEVFNISVVEPSEVDQLMPIEGKDVVTLVTCTPYGINSHRLLVQGEQIEVEEVVVEEVVDIEKKVTTDDIGILVCIILAILIAISMIRAVKLRNVKKAIKQEIDREKSEVKINKLVKQFEKDEARFLRREENRLKKSRRKEQVKHKKQSKNSKKEGETIEN